MELDGPAAAVAAAANVFGFATDSAVAAVGDVIGSEFGFAAAESGSAVFDCGFDSAAADDGAVVELWLRPLWSSSYIINYIIFEKVSKTLKITAIIHL